MSDLDTIILPMPAMLRRIAWRTAGLLSQRAVPASQKRQLSGGGLDHAARRSPGGGRGSGPWPVPGGVRAWLRSAWRRHRSRHQIARLDEHALRDIGVTYAEAEAEANKPFWRG